MYWSGISDNQLVGELPPRWGQLARLEVLYLRDNALSGKQAWDMHVCGDGSLGCSP